MRLAPLLCAAALAAASPALAGEARCWFDQGAVVVPAAFGDVAGDFILDLSAPGSLLHATTAARDGITTPAATRALRLAGTRTGALTLTVADLDSRTAAFPTSIAGVLGADALAPFVTTIRFAPCRVLLTRRRFAVRPPQGALALRTIGGVAAVEAGVSDGGTSRFGWFALDTGAPAVRVAAASLSRAAPAGETPPVRLRALSIGGRLFEQVPAGLASTAPAGLDGSIGTAVWSLTGLTVDLDDGWIELRAAMPPPTAFRGRLPRVAGEAR